MPPVISIVVPALCRAEVLERFLDAVGAQTYPHEALEVVVVDDGSPESLAAVFERFRAAHAFRALAFRRNERNRGRAATRNVGVGLAGGEVIFFVDVDNLLEPDACLRLAEYFPAGTARLAVRANVRCSQPALASSAYVRFFNSRYLGQRRAEEVAGLDLIDLPSRFFATDAVAVTRDALAAVGGFDEGFTAYGCEDEDLGIRLVAQGFRLQLGSRCHVVDNDVPTLRRACQRMVVYAERSVPRLLRKHPAYAADTMLSVLELPAGRLGLPGALKRRLLLWLGRPLAGRLLLGALERVDRTRLRVPGILYKLALVTHYLQGYRARRSEA